jgi:hypothetical protein
LISILGPSDLPLTSIKKNLTFSNFQMSAHLL